MGKMRSKKITDFLLERIKRTENSVLENHGAVPFDFDKLVRYHKVLERYDYGDSPESDNKEIQALNLEIETLKVENAEIEDLENEIKDFKSEIKDLKKELKKTKKALKLEETE